MRVDGDDYRLAFLNYLRTGMSIKRAAGAGRTTPHYIWHTRSDEKVRAGHAVNEGQIFAWDSPPPTGHPGEEYGCRCTAEPFDPGTAEYVEITLSGVSDTGPAWSSRDFVRHYYQGEGRGVTVRETGHLEKVVEAYFDRVQVSIQDQIAREAREHRNGLFADGFRRSYNMTSLVFSLGDTSIFGRFAGHVSENSGMLTVSGDFQFQLQDEFVDPIDMGIEVIDLEETIYENLIRPLDEHGRGRLGLPPSGPARLGLHTGEPYPITDEWSGHFAGRIYLDPANSEFGSRQDH